MILAGLAITSVLALGQLFGASDAHQNTVLSRINAVWYDLRFGVWPPQRNPLVPIVIVDLDEATQQREGRWPWDRTKVADLMAAIREHGGAIIGFDVVFSEPSANPIETLLKSPKLPDHARAQIAGLSDDFDSDATLAQALSDNTVLGYFFHDDGFSTGQLPPPLVELSEEDAKHVELISMPDYTANLPLLMENAIASGFVVAVPDADGIVRRMPLLMRHQGGVYSALSLEMARLALGATWIRLQRADLGSTSVTGVTIGRDITIPLDARGNMLVPYKGRMQSYPTISATDVLRRTANDAYLAQLQGAIVLVGTSALGLSDLRTTPLQTGFPGVEVHANVLDAILQAAVFKAQKADDVLLPYQKEDRFPIYYQPDWAQGAEFALLVFVGLILSFSLPGKAPLIMLLRAATVLGILVAFNVLLWHWWHLALPLVLQVFLVLLLLSMNIVTGHLLTARQKNAIQTLFGEYVPPEHVARMLDHPNEISLESEQREMTVLFADVRNFTALSESLSASDLKSLLNRYLSAVTEVIFEHHGTIDKYVGDLVMAFWNAPLNDPQHAKNAVAAALSMQKRMQKLRTEFTRDGLPQLYIGIGINTGPMNVGDMGSHYRRAYTVLGDAVNLASRLESLTTFYDTPILLSDTTRAQAEGFVYRTVDQVRVKGRTRALYISQPLGTSTQAEVIKADYDLYDYEHALNSYTKGDLEKAQTLFTDLSVRHPDERLYRLYTDRILTAQVRTDQTAWDPVFTHENK